MRTRHLLLASAALVLSACNTDKPVQAIVSNDTHSATSEGDYQNTRPAPNYVERDGHLYIYVTAVSDEEKAKGRAVGNVIMYKYLGMRNGAHVLVEVSSGGTETVRAECGSPCRIIKIRGESETIGRIPYDPGSVIGSAFEDAVNGHLSVANRAEASIGKQEVAARIPTVFVGEWNEDLAACGTGNNDSPLRISPTEVRFYESKGTLRSINVSGRIATVSLDMIGEGQTWPSSIRMEVSPSGDELTIDAFTRYRCP